MTLRWLPFWSLLSIAGCGGDGEIDLLASAPGADDDAGGAGCGSSGPCAGEHPHCDTTSGRCVECLTEAHCSGGETCDTPHGECRQTCSLQDPCEPGDHAICHPTGGFCVQCVSAADCSDPSAPVCDPDEHECQEN